MLGRYYAEKNRAYNEMFRITGYICSQRDEPVRRMRYGCRTMDYNGCEVIACYHALLSLGRNISFAEIADACSRLGQLYIEEDDEIETYKLVTSIRGNSLSGKISTESPIGGIGGRIFPLSRKMLFCMRTGIRAFTAFIQ